MIWRGALLFIPLLLGFLATLQFNEFEPGPEILRTANQPDYVLHGAEISAMNEHGEQQYLLKTPYVAHYLGDNRAQVTTPILWYYRDQEGPIRLEAEQADIIDNGDIIHLKGKVRVRRPASEASEALEVNTSEVWVDMEEKTATTTKSVVATSTRYSVQGLGASLSLESDVYQIHSQAESLYEPL